MGILYIPADEVVVPPVYAWSPVEAIDETQTSTAVYLATTYIAPRIDWREVLSNAQELQSQMGCTDAIKTIAADVNIRVGVVRDFLLRAGAISFDFHSWAVLAAAAIGKAGEVKE